MKKNPTKSDYKTILNKASRLCSTKEMCKTEIEEKLNIWGAAKSDFLKIIKYLENEKYIDEERYANSFIHDKLLFNHWGKVKLKYFLKQKKISENIISMAINNIDEKKYFDIIKIELIKKLKTIKTKNQFEIKTKLVAYVVQKGFETDMAMKVADEILRNIDN
ncbi:MAG: regulatory protein RecX [Bacteroidota bacterium]